MADIFLTLQGRAVGPYSDDQVRAMLREGKIRAQDLAWRAGYSAWRPLGEVLADTGAGKDAKDGAGPNEARETPEPVLETPPRSTNGVAASDSRQSPRKSDFVRRHPVMSLAVTLAGVAIVVVGFMLAAVPDHVSVRLTGSHLLQPDAGYLFVEPNNSFNWNVRWTPGTPSPTEAHVQAGEEAGSWLPAPGYRRPPAGSADAEVVWTPSAREPQYPHVAAGLEPGSWVTDPGWALTANATATNPTTSWTSGVRLPHMVSAATEDHWILDLGYAFADDSTRLRPRAVWMPRLTFPTLPHVHSSETEGKFSADAGYQWVDPGASSDFRTFSPLRTWAALQAANHIDSGTANLSDCSNLNATALIGDARDQYTALDLTDVHPDVVQHLLSVRSTLDDGTKTYSTCLVATNAGDGADAAAALACAGIALFSKQTYNDCMERSDTVRKMVHLGSDLAAIPCDQAVADVRKRLDDIPRERARFRSLLAPYGLSADSPAELFTCR